MNLLYIYLAFFIVTIVFSFLINSLFLKFSKNMGIRNHENSKTRWELESKPAFGGISFYILFLLSVIAFHILFKNSGLVENLPLMGLIAAVTLAFLMGLADDAYNTIPSLKLSTQICCGIILTYTGTYIDLFPSMDWNYVLTIFWVVAIMNSMNLLDNMDAISGIVSVFIMLAAMLIIYFQNDFVNIYFLLLIGVLSAVLGFLYFNWHPSKMYMGDTGSQFLGMFLAVIGIVYFWNLPYPSIEPLRSAGGGETNLVLIASKRIIIALLIFIIPIVDTTVVVINRIAKGKSPFIGGKDHTAHHLFYLGLTNRKIAILFMCICAVSLIFVYFIINLAEPWRIIHVFLFTAYFLLIFALLFYVTKISKGNVEPKSPSQKN